MRIKNMLVRLLQCRNKNFSILIQFIATLNAHKQVIS